jgi:hypothetical protein
MDFDEAVGAVAQQRQGGFLSCCFCCGAPPVEEPQGPLQPPTHAYCVPSKLVSPEEAAALQSHVVPPSNISCLEVGDVVLDPSAVAAAAIIPVRVLNVVVLAVCPG